MNIVDWYGGLTLSIVLIGLVSVRYLITETRWDTRVIRLVLDILIIPFLIVFIFNIISIAQQLP
jgi:hypothetical protein